MQKISGIKFDNSPKVYSFNSCELILKKGDRVVVETVRGLELGTVTVLSSQECSSATKSILRLATPNDIDIHTHNNIKSKESRLIVVDKVENANLGMTVVDVSYMLDNKLLITFTADNRVDFRDLVKDLATTLRTKIELRQVDRVSRVQQLGAIGPCGRESCCSIGAHRNATIKMIKNQNLPINQNSITGMCGRIKCCMAFENEHYASINSRCPKVGAQCCASNGKCGKVASINYINETVKIRYDDGESVEYVEERIDDIRPVTTK